MMKKCLSILLVVVILIGIMALPVAAAVIEPDQPARYPVGRCEKCGQIAEYAGVHDGYYCYYCRACDYTSRLPYVK